MKDKEGFWTGFYLNPIAIGINEQRWKEKYASAPYPQTFQELLDPKFKGEIGMSDPATSGTAYTAVASLAQVWGKDEMLEVYCQTSAKPQGKTEIRHRADSEGSQRRVYDRYYFPGRPVKDEKSRQPDCQYRP